MYALQLRALRRSSKKRSNKGAKAITGLLSGSSVVLLFLGFIMTFYAPAQTWAAGTMNLRESGASICGSERWEYTTPFESGTSAVITKGSRKDTKKITRIFTHTVSNSGLGLNIKWVSTNTIKYEIYVSGPNAGKIHKVFKPTSKKKEIKATYLYLFNFTIKPKVVVSSPLILTNGTARYSVQQQATITMPRQFPLKRDFLSDLIRRLFKFNFYNFTHTYTIYPSTSGGYVTVTTPF